jgi:hypothetical protein
MRSRKTYRRVLPLYSSALRKISCGLLVICLCSATSQAEKPFATIDVASTSEPFAAALSKARQRGFRVRLSFVAEDEVAVTSVNRSVEETTQLTVDFFSVVPRGLGHGQSKTLKTETGEPGLIALPGGGFLVDQGLTIRFFDRNHQERASKSVAELCGLQSFQVAENHDVISKVGMPFARNEAVLLLGQISRWKRFTLPDAPIQPPSPKTMFCWFDTNEGKPVAQVVGDPPTAPVLGESDRAIVWKDGSYFTPSGLSPSRLHCEREEPYRQTTFLPHAVRGEIRLCANGDLLFLSGGRVQKKHFAKGSRAVTAESLDAPILVLSTGHVHVGLLGGINSILHAEVFDYVRMKTVLQFSPEDLPSEPGFAVTNHLFAVSPSGKYVALLSGSRLAVYELKRK